MFETTLIQQLVCWWWPCWRDMFKRFNHQQPSIKIKKETFTLHSRGQSTLSALHVASIVNEGQCGCVNDSKWGCLTSKVWNYSRKDMMHARTRLFKRINTQDRALCALPARRSFAAPLSSSHSRIWAIAMLTVLGGGYSSKEPARQLKISPFGTYTVHGGGKISVWGKIREPIKQY